jgi:hypothetical protein
MQDNKSNIESIQNNGVASAIRIALRHKRENRAAHYDGDPADACMASGVNSSIADIACAVPIVLRCMPADMPKVSR